MIWLENQLAPWGKKLSLVSRAGTQFDRKPFRAETFAGVRTSQGRFNETLPRNGAASSIVPTAKSSVFLDF